MEPVGPLTGVGGYPPPGGYDFPSSIPAKGLGDRRLRDKRCRIRLTSGDSCPTLTLHKSACSGLEPNWLIIVISAGCVRAERVGAVSGLRHQMLVLLNDPGTLPGSSFFICGKYAVSVLTPYKPHPLRAPPPSPPCPAPQLLSEIRRHLLSQHQW